VAENLESILERIADIEDRLSACTEGSWIVLRGDGDEYMVEATHAGMVGATIAIGSAEDCRLIVRARDDLRWAMSKIKELVSKD
jgi:hypothetical protein